MAAATPDPRIGRQEGTARSHRPAAPPELEQRRGPTRATRFGCGRSVARTRPAAAILALVALRGRPAAAPWLLAERSRLETDPRIEIRVGQVHEQIDQSEQ